ncbi:MAG: PIN domain-containing protein [Chloroflexi bacterium]|nr:PIN domain-containing protein [Chloroflexota bacterium]
MRQIIFPDTGVLLSMIVFPQDQDGQLTLAGEVLALYTAGQFEFRIGQAVVDELDEVVDGRFQQYRSRVVALLRPFVGQFVRWPTPSEIAATSSVCTDPADMPIFASAILTDADIVLSNDFRAFHTPQAKAFWQQHNMSVESLYGLLCLFGQRERKDEG